VDLRALAAFLAISAATDGVRAIILDILTTPVLPDDVARCHVLYGYALEVGAMDVEGFSSRWLE
jgi:hypothetical protein